MTAKDGYVPPEERGEGPNDLQQFVDAELAKEQGASQTEPTRRRRHRTRPRHLAQPLPEAEQRTAADEQPPPPASQREQERPPTPTPNSQLPADLPPLKRRVAGPQLHDLEQLEQQTRPAPKRRLSPPPAPGRGPMPTWLGVTLGLVLLVFVGVGLVVLTQAGLLPQPTALNLTPQPRQSPAAAPSAVVAASSDSSQVASVASTITPTATLPAGFTPLPADAPDASWPLYGNEADPGTFNPLSAGTPYIYEGMRQGERCNIRLPGDGPQSSNGGQLWVNCELIGEPPATPVPTSPPPPPPTWTPVPQPPCFYAEGLNGKFERCGWEWTQEQVQSLAGPPLTGPPPTVCVASDDQTVTICGVGGPATMKLYANATAEAQAHPTPTP